MPRSCCNRSAFPLRRQSPVRLMSSLMSCLMASSATRRAVRLDLMWRMHCWCAFNYAAFVVTPSSLLTSLQYGDVDFDEDGAEEVSSCHSPDSDTDDGDDVDLPPPLRAPPAGFHPDQWKLPCFAPRQFYQRVRGLSHMLTLDDGTKISIVKALAIISGHPRCSRDRAIRVRSMTATSSTSKLPCIATQPEKPLPPLPPLPAVCSVAFHSFPFFRLLLCRFN